MWSGSVKFSLYIRKVLAVLALVCLRVSGISICFCLRMSRSFQELNTNSKGYVRFQNTVQYLNVNFNIQPHYLRFNFYI